MLVLAARYLQTADLKLEADVAGQKTGRNSFCGIALRWLFLWQLSVHICLSFYPSIFLSICGCTCIHMHTLVHKHESVLLRRRSVYTCVYVLVPPPRPGLNAPLGWLMGKTTNWKPKCFNHQFVQAFQLVDVNILNHF